MRRRTFIQGCSALMALASARLTGFALSPQQHQADTLVVVSLRGGWDALNVIVPRDGADRSFYLKARPNLSLKQLLPLDHDGQFGLHPSLAPLMPSWKSDQLAVVLATGSNNDSRSHFEATASMEAAATVRTTGWLGRYLSELPAQGFPAISVGAPSAALRGYSQSLTVESLSEMDFHLPNEGLLSQLYSEPGLSAGKGLSAAAQQSLQGLKLARKLARRAYRPKVDYPESEFGQRLAEAARMIKCRDLGVRALTVELDGWDTHSQQAEPLALLLDDLANGLAAFGEDLSGYPVTVVVISEFGRRLVENASGGTDHGRGSAMLVLGEKVKGGVFGRWPGLKKEQLFDLEDLAVTTDYRTVLSEILAERMNCNCLDAVFPQYGRSAPLGLFR
jgi:uncharacterized protein (DUF1501 family)